MSPENQLLIWRIVLWGVAPLVALLIGLLANFKIESTKTIIEGIKSEKSKTERLESENRIRDDIKNSSKITNENVENLSKKVDKVLIRLDDIEQKTIPIDEVVNSAINGVRLETSNNTNAVDHLRSEFSKFQTEARSQSHVAQRDRKRYLESLQATLADISSAVNDLTSKRSQSIVNDAIELTSEYLETGKYVESRNDDGSINLVFSVYELKNDDRVAFKEKLTAALARAERQKMEERSARDREESQRVQIVESYESIFLKRHEEIESFLVSFMTELKASDMEIRVTDETVPFDANAFVQKAKNVLNRSNLQNRIRTYRILSKKGLYIDVHFDATFYWEKMERGLSPFGMHLYGDEVKGFGTISWGLDIQKDGKMSGGREGEILDLDGVNSLMEEWILNGSFWHQ